MVKIGISVEGVTEERFVKIVLVPYLADKGILLTPILMGGGVTLSRVKADLRKMAHGFDYVTTFYDFYGFKGKADNETKETLEQKIIDHADDGIQSKLIPYVQMYEFEGLLFSSPESIASVLNDAGLVKWAQSILKTFNFNPERINDSPQTAPSKRLKQYTRYRKTTHGPIITREIGIDRLRAKCQGFNVWLQRIEALAV